MFGSRLYLGSLKVLAKENNEQYIFCCKNLEHKVSKLISTSEKFTRSCLELFKIILLEASVDFGWQHVMALQTLMYNQVEGFCKLQLFF